MNDPLEKEAIRNTDESGRVVVPLLSEELQVAKEKHQIGRVRVTTATREREELVDEILNQEQVEVERTAVGKPIEAIPPVREEGDTIVVPIVEEMLVIDRRL